MSTPKRIQRKRTKGWRMPEGAIYVGRPSKWGNPFRVVAASSCEVRWNHWRNAPHWHTVWPDGGTWCYPTKAEAAARAVELFEMCVNFERLRIDYTLEMPDPRLPNGLVGHDLACFCPLDQPCHADVLLELANGGAL